MDYYNFGCEFEFSNKYEDMIPLARKSVKTYSNRRLMTKIKNHCYYQSNNNKNWHLKTDSSTESELCTPVSTYKDVKQICDVISNIEGAKITKKDSFHIHCQIEEIPICNLVVSWMSIEGTILKCFPKNRRKNTYCQRLLSAKMTGLLAKNYNYARQKSQNRKAAMSIYRVAERNTIEIRIGNGADNIDYIKNWILFSQYFLNYAKNIDIAKALCRKNTNKKINWLIKEMDINDEELKKWLKIRFNNFKE